MIKEAQKNPLGSSESDDKDYVVIQDRPSLYSVEEKANKRWSSGSLNLSAAATDRDSMIDKLKGEISHLEQWLSVQKDSRKNTSLSVASTIRALIATRKSLLESLLKAKSS